MNAYFVLLAGIACAGLGGEFFVRGAVGLARAVRVSPGIIGATVAAFATSSPELSVSVNAALAGTPQIALGDALGSNVVNVALILALALVISGIRTPRGSIQRDFPVALLVPVVTGVLFLDGELSRADGASMLALFLAWLAATAVAAHRQRSAADEPQGAQPVGAVLLFLAAGLGLLVAAGTLIVDGARDIAESFGIDEFVIGATVVAVGTSAPELATAVVAKLRGHDEVGLGTILGSNIFNGLLIVAVAALIHPIVVGVRDVAIALVCGFVALAMSFPSRSGLIERRRGGLLLVLYAIYLASVLQRVPL